MAAPACGFVVPEGGERRSVRGIMRCERKRPPWHDGLHCGVVRVQLELYVGQLHEVGGCLVPWVVAKQVQDPRAGCGHLRPDRLVEESYTVSPHQASPEDASSLTNAGFACTIRANFPPSASRVPRRRGQRAKTHEGGL